MGKGDKGGVLQGTPLSANLSLVMFQCCRKIKDTVQKLVLDHKNIHSSVSRVGKAIDKVSRAVWDSWEKQQQVLQAAIVEDLYRQGLLGVAEELCQVTAAGRQRLLELSSSLDFKLHRLHFICLLAGGTDKQLEALSYARHFQPFAGLHQWATLSLGLGTEPWEEAASWAPHVLSCSHCLVEIRVVMGSLVYLRPGLEKSPYCHLLGDSPWAEICETFTRDACSLLGLSVESPSVFASGCVALPVLINIKAAIEQRQCVGVWSHKDELPIETDLGMKCCYHSVHLPHHLVADIDSNRPIKLICGHVISRDALNKLINGGKLKCPYCPMEQNAADGKRIVF
ncbi:E3 ubiquitin-protein transferase RMND5B [Saccopteryx bilineata]|uniref:E3 ubiquitin-protein transferase RMND5B n=1 Tax=Saccopteryx bilineata TaxID=59482 RepID=UPI00338E752E